MNQKCIYKHSDLQCIQVTSTINFCTYHFKEKIVLETPLHVLRKGRIKLKYFHRRKKLHTIEDKGACTVTVAAVIALRMKGN